MQTRNYCSWIKEEITRSISISLMIYIITRAPISNVYPIFAQQGYENPREATGRIVCANCHLANKPVDIEVPQAVLPILYSKQNHTKRKGGYEITIVDASDGREVIDIIPLGPEPLVSKGESIKLDQPLTSNPNVGGFGQGDAEIVLQDPLRVQGLLFFVASVILAQISLVLKNKQFEKFFASNGFPFPAVKNPSNHFLKTINKDFDDQDIELGLAGNQRKPTEEAIEMIVKSHESSNLKQESGIVEKKRGHANFQTQCIVLAKRSSVNMRRDVGYYWLRLGIYIIVAFSFGDCVL
ncbi:hypothetical protein K1719_026249 [Acacia pycnantha]|nr:hypothetical protein K1719_026249 [Acacia pycnantha]